MNFTINEDYLLFLCHYLSLNFIQAMTQDTNIFQKLLSFICKPADPKPDPIPDPKPEPIPDPIDYSKMKIAVRREYKLQEYTIGKMYLNEVYFCDTLEDTDRGLTQSMSVDEVLKIKVKGETAIPSGIYNVDMNTVSPKYVSYEVYKFCDAKLPRLLNVPGYEGILIHIGNTAKDTEGCILVGENKVKGQVINSTVTFTRLYNELKKYKNITIEIS